MENKNSGRGGKLYAKSASLIDLVEYQEGAVVSRTLIDRKAGTVTLFAFDEGQGLSEHTAPYDALVYLLEGETDIGVFGKLLRLGKGDVIILPANQPHAVTAVTKFKMILTMIRS
jgi:quercetin dioxygenase-like cupin family protein